MKQYYLVKLFTKGRMRARLTLNCDKTTLSDVILQLENENMFLRIVNVFINKEEIKYVKVKSIKPKRNKRKKKTQLV